MNTLILVDDMTSPSARVLAGSSYLIARPDSDIDPEVVEDNTIIISWHPGAERRIRRVAEERSFITVVLAFTPSVDFQRIFSKISDKRTRVAYQEHKVDPIIQELIDAKHVHVSKSLRPV